ncbi:MAG: 6-bladed beta-propeller [Acidobacteriota bacterium]|nr:6-bladed beta-propeller [Acidobacteriota bacterium]
MEKRIEEVFIIDTEKNEIAELGLTDPKTFDVDSEGNIYFLNDGQSESHIFKFDAQGNYETSFGRRGQGPGEIQFLSGFGIGHQDEIAVTDYGNKKLVIFDGTGNLVQETDIERNVWDIRPLKNGNYLIVKKLADIEGEYLFQYPILLCDKDFRPIEELDRQKIPNYLKKKSMAMIPYIFLYGISPDRIFIGNATRGYRIRTYDFDGNLLREIRKESTAGDKDEFLKDLKTILPEDVSKEKKVRFPSRLPPFTTFYSDDDGRLFVMTSKKRKGSDEYWVDIFNPEGIFIGQTSLKSLVSMLSPEPLYPYIKIKKDRLFHLSIKSGGFKKLAVYRMLE